MKFSYLKIIYITIIAKLFIFNCGLMGSLPFESEASVIKTSVSVNFSTSLPKYYFPWSDSWKPSNESSQIGKHASGQETDLENDNDKAFKTKRDHNSESRNSTRTRCKRKNGTLITKDAAPTFRNAPDQMQQLAAGHLGHRVELRCPHRKGCPKGKVEWFKDGRKLIERGRESGLSIIRIKQKGELIVEDNRLEDDGIYTCVISNKFGSIQHNIRVQSVQRVVAMEPKIPSFQPGNHTVEVGGNLTLRCELSVVDETSPYQLVWYKHFAVNGSWFDKDGKVYVNYLQDSQSSPPPGNDQLLQLYSLELNDTGWYSCVVSNQYGRLVRSGWVEVVLFVEEVYSAMSTFGFLAIGIGGASGLGLSCLLVVVVLKYKRERKLKEEAVLSAQCVLKWTKKIIIERSSVKYDGGDDILTPVVRVERVKAQVNGDWICENDIDNGESYEIQLDAEWEFPRELLVLGEELGHGAFGRVVKGLAYKSNVKESIGQEDNVGCPMIVAEENREPIIVAVKMLKYDHSEEEIVDLVKEIEIMKIVGGHPNIVNLLGACTQPSGQPLFAIMEFAELGNLRDHLRTRRGRHSLSVEGDQVNGSDQRLIESQPIGLKEMLNYSWQIGRGMQFLSDRNCVHRDLAARNVLVGRGGVAKIADFGLARDVQASDYYRKMGEAKLPILWMSPESLFAGISTTKSDVWSFGIVMWEILTCGERPYAGVATEAVLDLIKDGYRMSPPPQCPYQVFRIMRDCWHFEPSSRPSWTDLVDSLRLLHHQTLPGVYLGRAPLYIPTPPSSPDNSLGSYVPPFPPSESASRTSVLSLPVVSPNTTSTTVHYSGCMTGIAPLAAGHQPPPAVGPPHQPAQFPLPATSGTTNPVVRRMSGESGYSSTFGGPTRNYYNVTESRRG